MERKSVRILIAPEFYERAIAGSDRAMALAVATAVRMSRGTLSIGGGCSFIGSPYFIKPHRTGPTDDGATLLITDRLLFRTEREFDEAIKAAVPLPIV